MKKFWAIGLIAVVGVLGVALMADFNLFARLQFSAWPTSKTAHLMGKWNEYVWSVARIGTPVENIRSRFGSPHNTDSTNVWLWVRDYERIVVQSGITNWSQMATQGGDGYFIIVKDNHVASPPLPLSGSDVESLYQRMVVGGEPFPGKAGAKEKQ